MLAVVIDVVSVPKCHVSDNEFMSHENESFRSEWIEMTLLGPKIFMRAYVVCMTDMNSMRKGRSNMQL
jgi:hypothetical protein